MIYLELSTWLETKKDFTLQKSSSSEDAFDKLDPFKRF